MLSISDFGERADFICLSPSWRAGGYEHMKLN